MATGKVTLIGSSSVSVVKRPGVGPDQRAHVGGREADGAGEGRGDLGVGELELLARQRALQPRHLALGAPELRLGHVELALGDGLAAHQLGLAVALELGEPPLGLGGRDRALDLGHRRPVVLVLDAVEDGARLDAARPP